jgi:hypothetical protein
MYFFFFKLEELSRRYLHITEEPYWEVGVLVLRVEKSSRK